MNTSKSSKTILCLIILNAAFLFNVGQVSAYDPWWNSQWMYRKSITINHTLVDDTLLNFPVMINLTDSDLSVKAQNDGDDIVFADNAGTKLDHEIEFYDNNTGSIIAWVRVPNVSSSVDTVIYMYYGNDGASNQENAESVWISDFMMVHHLSEVSGNHSDSTGYGNDESVLGDVDQNVLGKINGADFFDGTNAFLRSTSNETLTGFDVAFTTSFWVWFNSNATTQSILNKYDPTGDQRGWYVQWRPWATPQIALVASNNSILTNQWRADFSAKNKTWYHMAVVWESDAQPRFYVDGVQLPTLGAGTITQIYNNTGTPLYIAGNYASDELNGILDEVRIANASRSSEWIAAEYRNQNNPQTFYSVGAEESGKTYYITASAGTGGSISPEGEVSVQEASDKTFYIIPLDGYHILNVVVDSVSQGALYAYTFTSVDDNHTIAATFGVTTPPTISKDKSSYDKGQVATITVSGGTSDKPIMLQIQSSTGTKVWAVQDNFASDGSYSYQLKIPSSWSYGTYTIHVRDVDAGTTKSASLLVQAPAPVPPPYTPPPSFPTNKAPIADAGPDQNGVVGRTLYFDGSKSSDPDGSIFKYLWIFDDGKTATGAEVSHTYDVAGEYNVTLSTIDNAGTTGVDYALVSVGVLPLEPVDGVDEGVGYDKTNHIVDALDEAGTSVKMNTTSPVTVSLLKYPDNPYPDAPLPPNSLPTVVDVFVSNHESIEWPIYVERHYTDAEVEGILESWLVLYYYSEGEWHMCRETGSYPDLNIVWANMYEDEVAGSPTLLAERPSLAAFDITNLVISPSEVEPDVASTVSATVTNIGADAGNYTVNLLVDGVIEDNETVSLDGLASIIVSFTVSKTAEGTYTIAVDGLTGSLTVRTLAPAEFELSSLDLSATIVEPGEEIGGSVMVTNIGEKNGTYTVEVELDGVRVYTESETLVGGASKVVTFIVSSDEAGAHTVEVDGLTGTFTVVALPSPAEFDYRLVSLSPTEVEPGETVSVDVEVSNVGEESGTYQIDLLLDGEVVNSSSGQLDGGEERLVFFTVTSDTEGTHQVKVGDDVETFTVQAPEQPGPKIPWLWIDLVIIVVVVVALYYARKRNLI